MNQDRQGNGKWSSASKYAFIGFLLVAGYFLLTEHRAHVFGALPYLLLAACPLLHFFHGHGGHGGHGDAGKDDQRPAGPEDRTSEPPQHHRH